MRETKLNPETLAIAALERIATALEVHNTILRENQAARAMLITLAKPVIEKLVKEM